MFSNTPTRRSILRVGAVILSGTATSGPAAVVDGRTELPWTNPPSRDERPPDEPPTGDGAPQDDPEAQLWPRLYKGTSFVELTYIQELDRIAAGEFDVDIQFTELAGLEQRDNPFAISIETIALRGGDFIVSPPVGYNFTPDIERTEGAVTFNSDIGESQFWSFEYDPVTTEIAGRYNGLPEYGNRFGSLHTLTFAGEMVFPSYIEAQSRFMGTITDTDLSLAFDLLDNELRVRCLATITANRIA